ncbi:MAG: LPS export ABC transporter ATP-binding protein, partial [Devosia sp.]
ALRARGIGVLVSDHNVRETLSIVDRAYVMVSGRVIAHGRPHEIAADENVRRFYLGNSLD